MKQDEHREHCALTQWWAMKRRYTAVKKNCHLQIKIQDSVLAAACKNVSSFLARVYYPES